MSTKVVVLCGAKGAGKSELLDELGKQYNVTKTHDEEWDRLADYRDELLLALHRSDITLSSEFHESSLIDSVAYAATRLTYIINEGIGTEDDLARWEIVLHASARLLRDSVLPDAYIYVPGNDGEDFSIKLEEAIVAAIWEFVPANVEKFELKAIDPLQRAEEIATILEGLNEQNNADTESDGEDQ